MMEGEKSGDVKHRGSARSTATANVMTANMTTAIVTMRIMRTTITAKNDEKIDGGKQTARERARGSGVVKGTARKSALRVIAGTITIGAVAPITILVATIRLLYSSDSNSDGRHRERRGRSQKNH